jgi:hypothetical protein
MKVSGDRPMLLNFHFYTNTYAVLLPPPGSFNWVIDGYIQPFSVFLAVSIVNIRRIICGE